MNNTFHPPVPYLEDLHKPTNKRKTCEPCGTCSACLAYAEVVRRRDEMYKPMQGAPKDVIRKQENARGPCNKVILEMMR